MLELPPEKASNLGLGPRSFRMREAPDMSDRSSWTDTPADKLRKMEQALVCNLFIRLNYITFYFVLNCLFVIFFYEFETDFDFK